MNEIVFLEPNYLKAIPFTTSKVISESTGIRHDKIKSAINKHKSSIETFGILTPYEVVIQGRGQPEKFYRLNEPQATLLITLLKNTEPVIKFKVELVRQFYIMKEELFKRKIERVSMKPVHKELADTVKQIPEHPSSKFDYSKYNNLAYMIMFGKAAKCLKIERGATPKAIAADYLTSDEMERMSSVKNKICLLIEIGMGYEEIKNNLSKIRLKISA